MTLEDVLLDGAQPDYADAIRAIAARWSALVPGPVLAKLNNANFYETFASWLEWPGTEDAVRLQVAADCPTISLARAARCWALASCTSPLRRRSTVF